MLHILAPAVPVLHGSMARMHVKEKHINGVFKLFSMAVNNALLCGDANAFVMQSV